ncbi:hypothetical protein MTBSS4_50008 [Magnetospirillum sp. SS-4]|nr:hypothetical protein MTBSS4_50008 [Magnetospirillum sp. SS-4]
MGANPQSLRDDLSCSIIIVHHIHVVSNPTGATPSHIAFAMVGARGVGGPNRKAWTCERNLFPRLPKCA